MCLLHDNGKARGSLVRVKVDGLFSQIQIDLSSCSIAKSKVVSVLFWLSFYTTIVTSEYSNLPDVPPGLFEASTRIKINATLSAAYNTLCDFPNYSSWIPSSATPLSPHLTISPCETNDLPKASCSSCVFRTFLYHYQ